MTNLDDLAARLACACKILAEKLAAMPAEWPDAVGHSFEKNHAANLLGQIKRMQQELECLRQLSAQAKKDIRQSHEAPAEQNEFQRWG